jgi:magnesium transporter
MVTAYSRSEDRLVADPSGNRADWKGAVWLDLLAASDAEVHGVEEVCGVRLFSAPHRREIESSSRFFEGSDEIGINLNFIRPEGTTYSSEPVSFKLRGSTLFSQRNRAYRSFEDTIRRIESGGLAAGDDILLAILEARIDIDADVIEHISDSISIIHTRLAEKRVTDRELLIEVAHLQQWTIALRENIAEKLRIISGLQRSHLFPRTHLDTLRVMHEDVESLVDHCAFNFQRLEFLQNTFLGIVNMEQNRVIRIFTVVTVLFMPPTLIASVYGMNFKNMPETDWTYGYVFGVGLMVVSSLVTWAFFRWRKWL